MSYNMTIRADERFSAFADRKSLHDAISGLPEVRDMRVGDGKTRWIEIDLEHVDDNGDYVDDGARVNCIRLRIPAGYAVSEDDYRLASRIADLANWALVDEQTGTVVYPVQTRRITFQRTGWLLAICSLIAMEIEHRTLAERSSYGIGIALLLTGLGSLLLGQRRR